MMYYHCIESRLIIICLNYVIHSFRIAVFGVGVLTLAKIHDESVDDLGSSQGTFRCRC